jgi:predicted SAM-dependent methyltransferase
MTLEEFRVAIRNVFNYLRPGGTFRLVLPDLEQLIASYVSDPSCTAASKFMRESYLGEATMTRGLKAMPTALFGRSRHLWMWDFTGMEEQLAEAGFTEIRRAQIGDSPDSRFGDVESEGRWTDCLGVDCRRP